MGHIYPDSSFGMCRLRRSACSPPAVKRYRTEDLRWIRAGINTHGVEAMLAVKSGCRRRSALGLSQRVNSHKAAKRGSKGISKHGQRQVRCAAKILQREHRKECLSFVTLTLPSVTWEESQEIARNASEITRKVVKAIKYHLLNAGLDTRVVGVCEIQKERSFEHGINGLHWHFVFHGRKKNTTWAIKPVVLDRLWRLILRPYLGKSTRSYASACQLVRLRSDASQYLAKYMSKGVAELAELQSRLPGLVLPKAWYSIGRDMTRDIRKATISGKDVGAFLISVLEQKLKGLVAKSYPVKGQLPDGRDITFGWGGVLQPGVYDWLLAQRSELSNLIAA